MPKSNAMLELQIGRHSTVQAAELTSKWDMNTKVNVIFEKEKLLNDPWFCLII